VFGFVDLSKGCYVRAGGPGKSPGSVFGTRTVRSGRVLRAVRVALAAHVAVAVVKEPEHGSDVRRTVNAMAHTLGHRIGGFRIAAFDDLVPLRIREAQLCHAMLAIEYAQLQMPVTHDSSTLRESLDAHTGPAVKLACDLIDERGRT
jgi:hypothetical protein